MRIIVNIRSGAREARVEEAEPGQLRVWVRAKPEKGEANAEMIALLAHHFGVVKSMVRIVIGKTAREKLVEIAD